ncbi:wax ester/triacylglycerol synthase family O-acyltransferase [Hydrogenophaga soli]
MVTRTTAAPSSPAVQRMSKVDTAWLRMDSAANLMMITGVWVLRPGISRQALCQRITERLLCYPRFTQRAEEDLTGANWVHDAAFDLDHHVLSERLPRHRKGGARQALQQRVAELAVEALDPQRPLWQFHLIENYEGGAALIARIHHCIADGMALIAVMMSLVDGGQEPPRRGQKTRAATGDVAAEWLGEAVIKPLTGMAVKLLDVAGDSVAKSVALATKPVEGMQASWQQTLGWARLGGQVVSDLAALALMSDDAATSLKASPSATKAVAWCEPISLEQVKAVGKALGCSVNDVLLSCVAGAFGQYLRERGEPIEGQDIRAMVPVNLRPMEQAWKLGNRFGLVPLVLPVGQSHPLERLFTVRQRMQALKGSTQPLLAFGLLSVAGLLVKPAQEAMLNLFSRKTTAVMTNVPGPAEKLKFCGSTLEQVMFWVPQSGDIGVGVSILSYGGGVQFGLITDTAMCPNPQEIIDRFAPQFEQLLWLSLMLPTAAQTEG